MHKPQETFEEAVEGKRTSLVGEFVGFLMENKKWWLLPIVMMFVLMGGLVIYGGGALPYIYSIF
jgi:hypothetical protein